MKQSRTTCGFRCAFVAPFVTTFVALFVSTFVALFVAPFVASFVAPFVAPFFCACANTMKRGQRTLDQPLLSKESENQRMFCILLTLYFIFLVTEAAISSICLPDKLLEEMKQSRTILDSVLTAQKSLVYC